MMDPKRPFWVLCVLVATAVVAFAGEENGTFRDAAALLRFKNFADPAGRLNSLWRSRNPCTWKGVVECTEGRVTKLVLEHMQLNGTFPEDSLNRLDQLRVLSLKGNMLRGSVPDLTGLVNLKILFVDHNLFTGPIPDSIPGLSRLMVVVMSSNFLSGDIPDEFSKLPRLSALFLDSNRLEGTLPALNQSSLKLFNVSYNQLGGEIPYTRALAQFNELSFSGNPRLCGRILNKTCSRSSIGARAPSPNQDLSASAPLQQAFGGETFVDGKRSNSHKVGKVVGIAVGCSILVCVLGILVFFGFYCKRERRMKIPKEEDAEKSVGEKSAGEENGFDQYYSSSVPIVKKIKAEARSGVLMFCGGEAPMYTLEDLLKASAETMGRGTLGITYKAVMENRMVVTVKRLKNSGKMSIDEFERHMEMVGKLRHQNIVSLKAYFQAKEERLLVYDYYSNGSLFSLLHGARSARGKPLHWTSCFKIAEDVANGLAYLHQASRLSHGNLKSSNVLLGTDFEACITDYCLTVFECEKPEDPEQLIYRAPECIKSERKMGQKSDVFSFGVLILELLTGKLPMQSLLFGQPMDLQGWVRSMREDDTELNSSDEKPMILLEIAMSCLAPSPERRPTMRQVLRMIEDVKDTQSVSSQSQTADSPKACDAIND